MSAPRNPDWHPDAESLSAFLEGALPEHERAACLAHFAECARCREVVFQAQEPAPVEIAPRPEPRWRRWWTPVPVFAAAAAICALVAGIAMYLHRKPEPPVRQGIAMVQPPPIPPAPPTPAVREPIAPPVHHHDVASAGVRPVTPQPTPTPSIQLDGISVSQQPQSDATGAYVNPRLFQFRVRHDATLAVNTSQIAGTVADASGAGISGALVRLQAPTGTTAANARTDANGNFKLVSLTPGRYELQVQSAGFIRATAPIELHGQDLATVTPVLAVGSMSESVEVTAQATAITVTGSTSDGIASDDLPVQGRSASKLVLTDSAAPSTVAIGKLQLRTDTSGALFRSQNGGKSWKVVKPAWKGKVVQLSTHDDSFQLTTDAGAVWSSRDGIHWTPAPPQH